MREEFWQMPQNYTKSYYNDLKALCRKLNDANIATYPIDPRGLLTDAPRADTIDPHPPAQFTSATTANAPFWATMDMVAQETGGRAFYNSNDISGNIQRAMEDARVTYLLGFYADSEPDDKYHNLEVKVLRPGLRVRARRGYFARAPRVDAEPQREAELRAAANGPLEGSAIGVTLNVRENPMGWLIQEVVVRVDPRDIRFDQKDGRVRAAIDVVLMDQARDGSILGGRRDAVEYALFFQTYEDALDQGLYVPRTVYVHPGAARVRAIVRDATTGAVGSVSVPVRQ